MKHILGISLALATAAGTVSTAYATTETWRLTAVVSRVQDGFTPPSFAQVGSTITVDYVFNDLDVTESNPGTFSDAADSITFNGQTVSSSSYVLNYGGLKALNTALYGNEIDGMNFMSLNAFNAGTPSATLRDALTSMANSFSPTDSEFRLDFNVSPDSKSVWAIPLSLSAVPEIGTLPMTALGLLLVAAIHRRQKALS